ncbi:GGDEF domain-containing protein [Ectopseudomonas mendocina]|uniref:diguanylate cyclase n=1 Tax=Ectopseudomonas mendocina TaxID=300 RepID=A0ABZ2RSW0_ECTME
MAPRTPSNTIDFDTAKLQRLGFTKRAKSPLKPVSLAQLRQQLSLRLQTSLEVERIIEMFFSDIQQLIPLSSLTFELASCDLRLELGERSNHSASYHLNHQDQYLGELTFRRKVRFTEEELGQLESLLASLVYPLRNALLYRIAIHSALRDPLTETGNRIAMDQALNREIDIARRNLQPLSILMIDIDHFKQINDNYGHSVGDQALKAVANAIKTSLRNVDMVFRVGGEEFLVLLSNTGKEAASMVGERLRQSVMNTQYLVDGEAMKLSISLGCAELEAGESKDQLMHRADCAMYASKRAGRNRLSMAS